MFDRQELILEQGADPKFLVDLTAVFAGGEPHVSQDLVKANQLIPPVFYNISLYLGKPLQKR